MSYNCFIFRLNPRQYDGVVCDDCGTVFSVENMMINNLKKQQPPDNDTIKELVPGYEKMEPADLINNNDDDYTRSETENVQINFAMKPKPKPKRKYRRKYQDQRIKFYQVKPDVKDILPDLIDVGTEIIVDGVEIVGISTPDPSSMLLQSMSTSETRVSLPSSSTKLSPRTPASESRTLSSQGAASSVSYLTLRNPFPSDSSSTSRKCWSCKGSSSSGPWHKHKRYDNKLLCNSCFTFFKQRESSLGSPLVQSKIFSNNLKPS